MDVKLIGISQKDEEVGKGKNEMNNGEVDKVHLLREDVRVTDLPGSIMPMDVEIHAHALYHARE